MSDPNATILTYQQGEQMKSLNDQYYAYPRMYFADGVGRPFSAEEWDKFIIAMDKFALEYMKDLESELARQQVAREYQRAMKESNA